MLVIIITILAYAIYTRNNKNGLLIRNNNYATTTTQPDYININVTAEPSDYYYDLYPYEDY
jgi:hypothetical protein